MRTIGVVTVGRSDYGILAPILERIHRDDRLRLALIVAGSHFTPQFGYTVAEIERDGVPITASVPFAPHGQDGAAVAHAIATGTAALADAFRDIRPDLVLVVGDRFELLAVASAATPLRIPLAHVHGGELSEGAFDESIRHALTKLSHIHFASTEPHASRIRQLGEEPWRIFVTGAPALDDAVRLEPLSDEELSDRVGRRLDTAPLLVTYHAATLDSVEPADRMDELLAALEEIPLPVVFTDPNADPGGEVIRSRIADYVRTHRDAVAVSSLGRRGYYSLLRRAAAMVGNSSSGLIEAPSFALPVVNVGVRQGGRLRAANVIDSADDPGSIADAIRRAVSPDFRRSLVGMVNPYGDGHASERIVSTLATIDMGPSLLLKRFRDANDDD